MRNKVVPQQSLHLKQTCSFSVAGDGIFKFPSSQQAVCFPALLMGLKEMTLFHYEFINIAQILNDSSLPAATVCILINSKRTWDSKSSSNTFNLNGWVYEPMWHSFCHSSTTPDLCYDLLRLCVSSSSSPRRSLGTQVSCSEPPLTSFLSMT